MVLPSFGNGVIDRNRIGVLILVMAIVAFAVGGSTIHLLYRAGFRQQEMRLIETVQSQARLLEAMVGHEASADPQDPDLSRHKPADTLAQIRDTNKHFRGIGETGGLVLARLNRDKIIFLFCTGSAGPIDPKAVPFDSDLAEPMRRALLGKSGTLTGLDYRGKVVLAAHEPVTGLNMGIVAKIDVAEIRDPFVRAALFSGSIALVLVVGGAWLFLRVSNPLLQQLKDGEARVRAIVDTAAEAIITINQEGIVESFNRAAERTFFYTGSEVVGKNVSMLIPSPHNEKHDAHLARYLRTGEARIIGFGRKAEARRKDGTIFPAHLAVSEVHLEGRRTFTGIIHDLTEQERAAAELRKLSVAVEQSPTSIVITDTQGTIEYVNPRFTEVTGYTAEEAIGQNPRILKSGKWPKRAYKALWDKILAGEIWTGEFENKKKSGEVYWEAASICPIRDAEGSITHFLAVKQDITDRKRAEWQLLEAKRHAEEAHAEVQNAHAEIRHLFEAISSVLIGVDGDGKVTAWNGAAASILGVDSDDTVGRCLGDLGIEWDSAAIERGVAECRTRKRPVRIEEIRFKRPNGMEGFLGITLNPVGADPGKDNGFLFVAADITEQKILQGQLAQAQKLESIGQLAAGIAHEINTPTQFVADNTRFLQDAFGDLQGLLAEYARLVEVCRSGSIALEVLAEVETAEKQADLDYLTEEIPKAIGQSLEGIERVSTIVRAMKDFSHPDVQGKESVDLNKAIESTITVAKNEWKYVAEMVTEFDPSLPPIPCFLGEFNQVILNIVVNAAHAIADAAKDGSEDKGTIAVTTRCDGDWVEIRIRDTGTGIPAEHRTKVFDHFFTTKEVGKGTGQGLAIAHAVVTEKHGGTLTFETEPGQGTTFIIRLPIEPETAQPSEAQHHEEAYSLRG